MSLPGLLLLLFILTMAAVTEGFRISVGCQLSRVCSHVDPLNHITSTIRQGLGHSRDHFFKLGMKVPSGEIGKVSFCNMGSKKSGNKHVNTRPMNKVTSANKNILTKRSIPARQCPSVIPFGTTARLPCSLCHHAVQRFIHCSLRESEDVFALCGAYLSALGAVREHCGDVPEQGALYFTQLGEAFAHAVASRRGVNGDVAVCAAAIPPSLVSGEAETHGSGGVSPQNRRLNKSPIGARDAGNSLNCSVSIDSGSGGGVDGGPRLRGGPTDSPHSPPPKGRRLVREGDRYVYR